MRATIGPAKRPGQLRTASEPAGLVFAFMRPTRIHRESESATNDSLTLESARPRRNAAAWLDATAMLLTVEVTCGN